jgi:CopG family nickel-responsive transcriptional regulator
MSNLVRFGVSMSQDLLSSFDKIISRKGYLNRSEAVRDLIRDYIVEDIWEEDLENIAGTITLIYDHDTRGINDILTHTQHHFYSIIISTSHVHFDEKNCLEVIIVKGAAAEIKKLYEKLSTLNGIKQCKISVTAIL